MSAATDLSEAYKALRTALLADVDVVANLATNASIFDDFPEAKPAFPLVIMQQLRSGPLFGTTFVGEFRPVLRCDFYGVNPFQADAFYRQLQESFSIPLTRTASIDSTSFRITSLSVGEWTRGDSLRLTENDQQITQHHCELTLRVIKKTGT